MNLLNLGVTALLAINSGPNVSVQSIQVPEAHLESGIEELFKTEGTLNLEVPYVNQYHDLPKDRQAQIGWTACGPTSLTMSFLYHGVDTNLITVIDKLPSEVYVKGAQFYNLKKGAEIYDFEAVEVEKSARGIYNALKEGYPVIINVQNYMGYVGHGMVVTGIKGFNEETGTAVSLIVHDPTAGPNQEFKFTDPTTLEQPEIGVTNYIGTINPFYIKPK